VEPSGALNEVVLTKHRFDAFQGTPLDLYLRNNGVRTVVITGVVTSGCVESTVRHAFFLDYHVVVPRDAVHESNSERHDTGLKSIGNSFATIVDVNTLVNAWRSTGSSAKSDHSTYHRTKRPNTSLIVMDMLDGEVHDDDVVAKRVIRLLNGARAANIPILHVRSINDPVARGIWDGTRTTPAWYEAASPKEGEMIIDKRRRSAFADTRLSLLLRTNEVGQVLVAGRLANGSLQATCLAGLDADYDVTVISDAIDAGEPAERWRPFLENAGAAVTSVDEVIRNWELKAAPPLDPYLSKGAAQRS
jgi:nicotinamidase-related amidase